MEYKDLYTFCPHCKATLHHETEHFFKCLNCEFYFYINPVPCNAVIVENEQGEILLVKRKYNPFKGFWDIPGGFVNTGETIEKSVQREVLEELGATIENLRYFASFHDRYLYKNTNYFTLGFVFTGTLQSKNVVPHDDVEEVRYFPKHLIPFDTVAFESVKKGLKKYIAEKK